MESHSEIDTNNLDEWNVVYEDFHKHKFNDRAFAIIGAAMVDAYLIRALRWAMVGDVGENRVDDLFEYKAPLGSASARIGLAVAMGVINMTTRTNLDNIRKIRNEFAHGLYFRDKDSTDTRAVSFDEKEIHRLCQGLCRVPKYPGDDNDPREKFYWVVHETLFYLHKVFKQKKPPKPSALG